MLVIDSSVIIAAFRRQEERHNDALEILNFGQEILLLDYVLAEVLTVLKMKEGYKISNKCLDFLENCEGFLIRRLANAEFKSSVEFFKLNNNKLSFVDVCLVTFTKAQGLPLVTFDKELADCFNAY